MSGWVYRPEPLLMDTPVRSKVQGRVESFYRGFRSEG